MARLILRESFFQIMIVWKKYDNTFRIKSLHIFSSFLIIPIRLILKDMWSKDETVKQTKWLEDLTKGKRERIILKIMGKGIKSLKMMI